MSEQFRERCKELFKEAKAVKEEVCLALKFIKSP
jgi:hypothetical protein